MSASEHTILVVDDNEMNRDALARRFERKGYTVLRAEDGYQALDMVGKHSVDLILLDIMMPGITGLDVLKILRQSHSPVDLPIVMASAKDENKDMIEALGLGANDYVTKPIDFPLALARVQAHLRVKSTTNATDTRLVSGDVTRGQIKPGVTLADRYRLEAPIGEGSFGTVYRAYHLGLEHPIAVKVLKASVANTPDAVARFQREGITACRVQHPNAVSIFDFGVTAGDVPYLVMELLEGLSLETQLREQGPLSPQRCGEILTPVCDLLAFTHAEGIIHRDLKPANIFLHQGYQGAVVKVVDFGIATLVGGSRSEAATVETQFVGTPSYTAPERIVGQDYDGRADVYSLGVMLYEMLCGQRPLQTQDNDFLAVAMMQVNTAPRNLREVNPDVPAAVEDVVMQALEKNPNQRPTVTALASAFSAAASAA